MVKTLKAWQAHNNLGLGVLLCELGMAIDTGKYYGGYMTSMGVSWLSLFMLWLDSRNLKGLLGAIHYLHKDEFGNF